MEGQVVFYKDERILYRHLIDVQEDDFSRGVNEAIISFQRNYAGFDLANGRVQMRFKKPGDA